MIRGETLKTKDFLKTYATQLTNEQIEEITKEKREVIFVILNYEEKTIIAYATDPTEIIKKIQNSLLESPL